MIFDIYQNLIKEKESGFVLKNGSVDYGSISIKEEQDAVYCSAWLLDLTCVMEMQKHGNTSQDGLIQSFLDENVKDYDGKISYLAEKNMADIRLSCDKGLYVAYPSGDKLEMFVPIYQNGLQVALIKKVKDTNSSVFHYRIYADTRFESMIALQIFSLLYTRIKHGCLLLDVNTEKYNSTYEDDIMLHNRV